MGGVGRGNGGLKENGQNTKTTQKCTMKTATGWDRRSISSFLTWEGDWGFTLRRPYWVAQEARNRQMKDRLQKLEMADLRKKKKSAKVHVCFETTLSDGWWGLEGGGCRLDYDPYLIKPVMESRSVGLREFVVWYSIAVSTISVSRCETRQTTPNLCAAKY